MKIVMMRMLIFDHDSVHFGENNNGKPFSACACTVVGHTCRVLTARVGQMCYAFALPDSGSNANMFPHQDYFVEYTFSNGGEVVIMGDGTKVLVAGQGTAKFVLDGKVVQLPNVFHIPNLDVVLLSIWLHWHWGVGCEFLADNSRMFLMFPQFVIMVDD